MSIETLIEQIRLLVPEKHEFLPNEDSKSETHHKIFGLLGF